MEKDKDKMQDKLYFELATKSFYESKEAKGDTEEKNWYVEALVATTDRDVVDDIITPEALKNAAKVLKEQYKTVLYNHQANRPIGKVIDAKVKDLGNGRKGLWVKIMISKTEEEIWQKIKEGVLSKFSFWAKVERKPVYRETEDGKEVIDHYLITDMYPFECSLVSVPANPNAVALDYYIAKHLKEGGIDMQEQKEIQVTPEKIEEKVEQDTEKIEETKDEVKKEETLETEQFTDEDLVEEEQVDETVEKQDKKPKIRINKTDVDYTPWSKVNKIRIRNILYQSGNKTAINEMYGVVRSYERMTDWGYPHHVLKQVAENTYEMILSYTGLMAAYKAMRGARGGGRNLTDEERRKLKSHLRKHFRYLIQIGEYEEMPEGLKALAYLVNLSFALEDGEIEIVNKEVDKNFKNSIDCLIEEQMKDLEKELGLEETLEKEPEAIEVDENSFFEQLRKVIREELENFMKKEPKPEENKEEETTETKELEKEKEEMKENKVEEKLLKIIEDLSKEINLLKKEIELLKSQPEVRGIDSQREQEEDIDISEFIKSEEFEKLPLDKQLEILKILMSNAPVEVKEKELKKLLKEIKKKN